MTDNDVFSHKFTQGGVEVDGVLTPEDVGTKVKIQRTCGKKV